MSSIISNTRSIFLLSSLASITSLASSATLGPVRSSSFTWYDDCDPGHLPACGPNARTVIGTGFAATNKITYMEGQDMVNGIGHGCGTCWHLQPQTNPNPSNGNHFGTPVVVKINDACTDGGYCDQTTDASGKIVGNTKYGADMHFDLCTKSGVADQFFGSITQFGQLLGKAQQVSCDMLTDGTFGSGAGTLGGGSNGNGVDTATMGNTTSLNSGSTDNSAAGAAAALPSTFVTSVAAAATQGSAVPSVAPAKVFATEPDASGEVESDDCEL